jgi:lysozyme family protein
MTFHEIIDKVLEMEGGYVDHKDDRGGETNFGISKRSHPDVDMKNLTKEGAKQIYYEDYWIPSKAEMVPDQLKEIYFDMVVNFGLRGAVKVLQNTCNAKNTFKIKVDGRIGPATISASKNVEPDRLRAYRLMRFAKIVIKNPSQEIFWYGWFRRSLRV